MDLGSILQCSVCHDPFTRPKVLPCQHTYCYSCLLGLVREEKSVTCPQCRGVHQLPDTGVEGLPDNLTIKNLLDLQGLTLDPDLYAETVLCMDCTNAASVSSCDHCQEKLCSKCLVKHAKLVGQIENSLFDLKDFLKSHSEVSDDDQKRDNLDGINFEEERIDFEFDKVQEELEKRRQYFKDYFAMIKLLYQDLSAVKVGEACAIDPVAGQEKSAYYTSVETLNSCVSESKTCSSLESLRLRVNDARSAARLVVRGERFRFVWEGVELGELARVEAGEGTVRIEGLYGDAGIREQKTPREQSRQAAPTQPRATPPQPTAQEEVLKQQELLWQQIKNLNEAHIQIQAQFKGWNQNQAPAKIAEEPCSEDRSSSELSRDLYSLSLTGSLTATERAAENTVNEHTRKTRTGKTRSSPNRFADIDLTQTKKTAWTRTHPETQSSGRAEPTHRSAETSQDARRRRDQFMSSGSLGRLKTELLHSNEARVEHGRELTRPYVKPLKDASQVKRLKEWNGFEEAAMVQTSGSKKFYGVVRWMGYLPGWSEDDPPLVGIELDEDSYPDRSNSGSSTSQRHGVYDGYQLFECQSGRGAFLSGNRLQRDSRFEDAKTAKGALAEFL